MAATQSEHTDAGTLSPVKKERLATLSILIAVLATWELIVKGFDVSMLVFAAPSDIAVAMTRGIQSGLYWEHFGVTLFQMLTGFLIGASMGLALGIIVSEFGKIGRLLFPYMVAVQSLPKVAVAPLIILWFGFGIESKVVVVALITFFPVLVNTISGLSIVDTARIDLMKAMLANRWQTFAYVRLPSAAPTIFAGLNVAIVLALTGSIVAEFVGAQRGLGVLIMQAQSNLDTAAMFVVLIFLATIGLLANLGMRWLERRVIFWAKRRESEQ